MRRAGGTVELVSVGFVKLSVLSCFYCTSLVFILSLCRFPCEANYCFKWHVYVTWLYLTRIDDDRKFSYCIEGSSVGSRREVLNDDCGSVTVSISLS